MVADSALPVWSIRPNWQNGITETLEWLSDVLRNSYGIEQVRALRLSPRRTFEMSFNPVDQERAFFDLWLHRMSSDEFMLPLWHDQALTTADIAIGATAIPFDNTFREFEVGGLALLVGADAFTCDKVTITAMTDAGITVAPGGVTRAWPAGSSIHPLRRARLEDQSAAAAITSRLGDAKLRFDLNQANDIADVGEWPLLYAGYPVIVEEPNRRDNLKLTFDAETVLLDNSVGLRELQDDAGRAFTAHTHLMMLVGRQEQWQFRQMLYRLNGQQGAVWLPTFNNDVVLSRDAAPTDAFLNIGQVGYAYTGGVVDGRQHLLLDGSHPVQVSAVGAPPSSSEERLNLLAAAGVALPAGAAGSFMDTCRLATDSIQIDHITDSDGVAEANLSFRSFRDQRTTPDPINYPIPAAAQTADRCGVGVDDACAPVIPDTGYWGRLLINTALGINIPVMPPWSCSISLYRAGVLLGTMYSSDNYTDRDGGAGHQSDGSWDYLNGWTSTFFWPELAIPRGEPGYAVDIFAAGNPDQLRVNIQWPYNNYIFPGGSTFGSGNGVMGIKFERLNGPTIDFGTIPIFGLWPASYTLSPV